MRSIDYLLNSVITRRNAYSLAGFFVLGASGLLASTLAVSGTQADGAGAMASFNSPSGVAVDAAGNVYVADFSNHKIRKIIIQE